MLKELKKKPHKVAALKKAYKGDRFEIYSSDGSRFAINADQVRTNDRYTNGSFMFDSDEHGEVADVRRSEQDKNSQQLPADIDANNPTLF